MIGVPEITIYPETQEQYEWMMEVIQKGQDAFELSPLKAVVMAFRLLQFEAELHTKALRDVRRK